MTKKITNPQQKILDYIVAYAKEHSYPPSVREICAGVGLTSTSTVHAHLNQLERRGLIEHGKSKQRTIRIADAAEAYEARSVPLVGRVAAGSPILAVENVEDRFPLPQLLTHGAADDETFMLRVDGDSMINAGIRNGDVIVVNGSLSYEDGDIVVARISDETVTVKRIYRESTYIRLQPENDAYEPILVPYPEVEVAGKVVGLMRSFR